MRFIGRGWQYSVYSIGNGKVYKRYNSWFEAYREMLKEQLSTLKFPVLGFTGNYFKGKKLASESLKRVVSSSLDQNLFGNPKIVGKLEYEQDFIVPLSCYFKHHSLAESKEKIDSFIKFCLLLHKNSLIEKNFNMADNFGLNKSGEIVLSDLGEICSTEKEIAVQTKKRVWMKQDVLGKFPAHLHEYFIQKMDETFG